MVDDLARALAPVSECEAEPLRKEVLTMNRENKRRLFIRAAATATFGSLIPIVGNATGSAGGFGCDQNSGAPQQTVVLSVGDRYLAHWTVVAGETRPVVLPNGFHLGVKIEPASPETYADMARRMDARYVPEMVEITLFDLTTSIPRELTHTWGGANSLQGYGPHGGADRVDAVGSPGVTLFLNKANCVRVGT